jgi:hypothetical protein
VYVIDANTLSQTEAVPLRYIPKQVAVSGDKLYISFERQNVLYVAETLASKNGRYSNIGFIPQYLSVENDKLVAVQGSFVILTDLNTLTTTQTGIPANAVRISGGRIYTSGSNFLNIYNANTLAQEGSIYTGSTISAFTVNGDYAILGGKVFSISQKTMLFNTNDTILAQRGNTIITNNGVFSIADGAFISTYKVSGSIFYLSPEFDFYYLKDNKIMLSKSADGEDLTEAPQITGIEENGNYNMGVSIGFSRGVGYVDTQKIESGAYYNAGGYHMFTLMLSCGIRKTIKFYIMPVLAGIRISGGNRSINVGDKINLSVQFLPSGTRSVEVTFSTANPDIVAVTHDGTVTGLKEGTAIVKVTTAQGGFTDECAVTVSRMLIEFRKDSGYATDRNNVLVNGIALGTFAGDIIGAVQTEGVAEVVNRDGQKMEGAVGTGMYLVLKNKADMEIDRLMLSVRGHQRRRLSFCGRLLRSCWYS